MSLILPGQPLRHSGIRICRGCGCDDNHACVTEEGPCAWALLDIDTPTGVCSVCAAALEWDAMEMAVVGCDQLGPAGPLPRGPAP